MHFCERAVKLLDTEEPALVAQCTKMKGQEKRRGLLPGETAGCPFGTCKMIGKNLGGARFWGVGMERGEELEQEIYSSRPCRFLFCFVYIYLLLFFVLK